MNKLAAENYAREMVKSFIEHQQVTFGSGDGAERGTKAAEFVKAMHQSLTAYFQTTGGSDRD